jgi:hypothetical protein
MLHGVIEPAEGPIQFSHTLEADMALVVERNGKRQYADSLFVKVATSGTALGTGQKKAGPVPKEIPVDRPASSE